MSRQLAWFDPVTQKADFVLEDGAGGVAYYTEQDVEPTLDLVRSIRDQGVEQRLEFRHVAEVPLAFVDKAMREGWFNDPASWRRFLNDSDNRAFRTWEGRL